LACDLFLAGDLGFSQGDLGFSEGDVGFKVGGVGFKVQFLSPDGLRHLWHLLLASAQLSERHPDLEWSCSQSYWWQLLLCLALGL
jgi:hypothetical protein